jgi:sterol desaturase/sphingolipid hydroxylase (fatty acid hydroxylase superfamily)
MTDSLQLLSSSSSFYMICIRLSFWFLVWTFAEYWMHRLMHWRNPYNFLYHIHREHHKIAYNEVTDKKHQWPKLMYFIFFFDNINETLEIVLGETVPALLIYWIDPTCGIILLIFHYIYEILATDSLLEHNADIKDEAIISSLAIGQFHLEHHRHPEKNFSFTITLWDHVFGTFSYPRYD